ncbi:hypothetical protein [uncultured Roseibium sp.]|uniref:relaxase/mobilization nuclease domain-containing protein n=1 Tax=uncultured Roseibium sp. TaxID=1936171 RepID=UPI00261928A5|nr:hypothetical protein [uncultured Roseibium sp.]
MIAGVTRHVRTQRDTRALVGHLLKPENEPRVRILGGTLATDLPGAVRDMERLRDSTSAEAAALHIHLSPSRALTDDELARAAEIVRDHFGAADHPVAFVVHDKERPAGEGHSHAHLVLGRVSPSGKVLESGFSKIKLETASRLIEFELGEAPVLGRHHKSAVRWLRNNGREDVADWLEGAYGPDPDKPTSAASPEKRQALARRGIDLSDARAEIRDAWKDGGAEAIRSTGYDIEPGRKSGVWIVAREGVEIGSLDRIVGEKRADIRNAMEAAPDQISRKESRTENAQRSRKPVQRDSHPAVGDPSSEKSAKFRAERSGLGPTSALPHDKKKTGAEQVSEAAADQARQFSDAFRARHDDRRTVAAAHHWLKDRRAGLKGEILESSQSPDDTGARREVARSRRELAVLDAAVDALRADPTLAYGGEKVLMGAARRLHAKRTGAVRDEIRTALESGGVAALRNAGYEIAPGRDGAWSVLRNGVPLGTLHRLIGEKPVDVRMMVEQAVVSGDLDAARSRAQVDLLDAEPEGWQSGARKRSSSVSGAENSLKSPQARTSENYQPSRKPVQRDSGTVAGDPSSGKRRPRRSPQEALAAAERFLDRLDAALRSKITDLGHPDKLPEPKELTDARRHLSAAACEHASWDDRHGSRITDLRLRTGGERPTGVLAWVSGATARWDQASCELAALFDDREPLRRAKAEATRALRILQTAQETRQVVHDEDRRHRLLQLRHQEELLHDARAALKEDPTIAYAGAKGLAKAAKERQTARLSAQNRADENGYTGGSFGL